ncbi:MAG: M20/M25/M40 family metallo-hydrolase [Saprospiraceae bacterium]|nr:M20/M25/M40 family metallo-hydrolase [Saprospiraceae bacterium]
MNLFSLSENSNICIELLRFNKAFVLLLCLVYTFSSFAQRQTMTKAEIIKAADEYKIPSFNMFRELLKIPNNGNFPEQMEDNANWCVKTFNNLKFSTQILRSEGIPHVLAERVFNKNYKTILFYLQIDGQPVDSSKWHQRSPYIPSLKKLVHDKWEAVDWKMLEDGYDPDLRIFARSASDSKGPAMAFISAMEILNKKSISPKFNIKVIMDFQEELGSPALTRLVSEKPALFNAELMLIMDGARDLSNLPTLTFGARGIATVTLKVFGATRDLHSGQYGNFAPNPIFKLADLIAGMKDENGRVTLPGFYEGVDIDDAEKEAIEILHENQDEIKRSLGIADMDHVGTSYQESLLYPSLNVRGIQSGWVGQEVRTLIPSTATAEIDMRLVPETPAERQIKLLKDYILSKNFHFVDSIPTIEERQKYTKLISMKSDIGSLPFRTKINSSIGQWLSKAMYDIFDDRFVKTITTGGSQPIAPFINTLNIPAVSIRIPNPDNNIHAPNENIRVGNYVEGIQMCLSILMQEMK